MERDHGKLFIGGISWDTDEIRLKEYFGQYGEILEAVIMRDRITGRARGFGFIVFAEPGVAERVVMEKHIIDGRTVEAKKAVPRDDQQILGRNNGIQGSPAPGRTKKIFVGGLASSVTETDFKNYFDEFGNIIDVVVMYDHNTQRPRGFGFITFDSEDAVDRVLHKTFHELNGKMVEVKRAVPKELSSPSPNRSPLVAYNYGMSRAINPINNNSQRYNLMNTTAGFGRFNQLVSGQSGLPPLGNFGYGMDMGMGMGIGMDPRANGGYDSRNYGRILGAYTNGNANRYNTPIGYNNGSIARGDSLGNYASRDLWGNGSFNNSTDSSIPAAFLGSSNGNLGISLGNGESNWGTTQTGGGDSGYSLGSLGNGFIDNGYGSRNGNYGRSHVMEQSRASSYGDLHRSGGLAYGDTTWSSASPELGVAASLGFGIGNTSENVGSRSPGAFMGSYSAINRQANRGIAA